MDFILGIVFTILMLLLFARRLNNYLEKKFPTEYKEGQE